ncbi:MAG: hypothetical protein RIR16_911 [Actinomycetota bacterium]|jgi:hypothetical protein
MSEQNQEFEAQVLAEIEEISSLPIEEQPARFNQLRDQLETELGAN